LVFFKAKISVRPALCTWQVRSFFKEAALAEGANGHLDWGKIKGLLQDNISTCEVRRQMTTLKGKFHPLSVWKAKEYDEEKLRAKAESDLFLGECNILPHLLVSKHIPLQQSIYIFIQTCLYIIWKDCRPSLLFFVVSKSLRFGEVFKVPTLEVSFQQVSEEVRSKVLQAERKVGKKRILVASVVSCNLIRYSCNGRILHVS